MKSEVQSDRISDLDPFETPTFNRNELTSETEQHADDQQPSHSDGQWSVLNGVTNDRLVSNPLATNDSNTRITDGMNTNTMGNNSPTDISDTTESSEDERIGGSEGHSFCPVNHEGRELVNIIFPLKIDDLFTLLFTNSSFYMEFLQGARKATDLCISRWQEAENPSQKIRQIAYTLPINNSMGVKSTRVSETQTLSSCSKPGELYIVDADVSNGGIPYADTFFVGVHYCLLRYGQKKSKLVVHAEVKYKKSVWGIVKTFIEKNSIAGLEEHFSHLEQALQVAHPTREEEERNERRSELPHSPPNSLVTKNRHMRPQRRRRVTKDEQGSELRRGTHPTNGIGEPQIILKTTTMRKRVGRNATDISSNPSAILYFVLFGLIVLLCVNGMLFTKLWALEELTEKLARKNPPQPATPNMADIHILKSKPQTQEDWLELLRRQEAVYRNLESKWKVAISTITTLWQQTQVTLQKLEKELEPEADSISDILEEIKIRPVSIGTDSSASSINTTTT